MSSRRTFIPAALCAAVLLTAACGDEGTNPSTLRFGQIGEVRLHLSVPIPKNGQLQQSLTWNSSGPWQLTEAISYNPYPQLGAETLPRKRLDPTLYAVWISLINGQEALSLFVPELDRSLVPDCDRLPGGPHTRLTLSIRDDSQSEERRWIRCADGALTLSNLISRTPAGQDAAASRVAQAAVLLKDYTVDQLTPSFMSAFSASLPFATLARGEDTPVQLSTPTVIESPSAWSQFWTAHTGSAAGLPAVDFETQVVLVAAIGQRFESGEMVEVRRVVQVTDGTLVFVVWSVPGNFCSPVARTHRPIHVVVAPKLPKPITFADVVREEVPCGG